MSNLFASFRLHSDAATLEKAGKAYKEKYNEFQAYVGFTPAFAINSETLERLEKQVKEAEYHLHLTARGLNNE